MINIRVVKCKQCSSVITSRANHDFNTCKCGQLSVDGGYFNKDTNTQCITRIIGSFQQEHLSIIPDIPVTPEQLYNDWNKGINEFKYLEKYA